MKPSDGPSAKTVTIFNANGAIAGYLMNTIINTIGQNKDSNSFSTVYEQALKLESCSAHIDVKDEEYSDNYLKTLNSYFGMIINADDNKSKSLSSNDGYYDNFALFGAYGESRAREYRNTDNYSYYLTEYIVKDKSLSSDQINPIRFHKNSYFSTDKDNKLQKSQIIEITGCKTTKSVSALYLPTMNPDLKERYPASAMHEYANREPNALYYFKDRRTISLSGLSTAKSITTNSSTYLTDAEITTAAFLEQNEHESLDRSDAFFNYTYTTSNGTVPTAKVPKSDIVISGAFEQKVNFIQTNDADKKLGYFMQDSLTGVSGDDKLLYNGNVIHYGVSFSPEEIKSRINSEQSTVASGIVAENFAGLLITDSSGKNVMFIENNGPKNLNGSTWNYVLEPAKSGNTSGGLLIEVE